MIHGPLVALGAGVMIGWSGLPLLKRLAVRGTESPGSRQRALTLTLLLSNALLLAPWVRIAWPTVPARFGPIHAVLLPAPAQMSAEALCHMAEALGVLWLVVTFMTCVRSLVHVTQLKRCIRNGRPAPRDLLERVRLAAADMRIDPPAVVIVNDTDIPFVSGIWEPVFAMPASLLRRVGPTQIDLIIRHELAHLARKDLLSNGVVLAACLPFAWHPTARRTIREIALAREEAVDSAVGSGNPRAYAGMLVEVAAGVKSRPRTLFVGVETSSLERRVMRLLEPRSETHAAAWRVIALASALFAVTLVAPRFGLQHLPPTPERQLVSAETESAAGTPGATRRDCPDQGADRCHPASGERGNGS